MAKAYSNDLRRKLLEAQETKFHAPVIGDAIAAADFNSEYPKDGYESYGQALHYVYSS